MNSAARRAARTITAALALGAFAHLAPPASAQAVGGFGERRGGGPPVAPAPAPAPPSNNGGNNNGGGSPQPPAPVIVRPVAPPAPTPEPPRPSYPEPPRQIFVPQPSPPSYPSPVINMPTPAPPTQAGGNEGYQNNNTPAPPQVNITRRYTNNGSSRQTLPNAPSYPNGPGYRNTNPPENENRQSRPFPPVVNYRNTIIPPPTTRVTTPEGQRYLPNDPYNNNNYIYPGNSTVVITNGPVLLGGYFYGNYCDQYYGVNTYPSVYGAYGGFPSYIYNPSVIVLDAPPVPVYYTPYLPFYAPSYPVTYNENNYYVTSPQRAEQIQQGGEEARQAIKKAYPASSFQAAFADIARAWMDGSIAPLQNHVRDADTKISVFSKKKYSYSIATSDYLQITRDALDRLQTVSFDFTRVRKAKNGDITAFGKHVYRVTTPDPSGSNTTSNDGTVPFDQADKATPYDKSGDPAQGEEKTIYVSYTLRHRDNQWYIIAVDSSPTNLVTVSQGLKTPR